MRALASDWLRKQWPRKTRRPTRAWPNARTRLESRASVLHAPCYAQGGTTPGRPGASVEGDCRRDGRNAGQRMQRLIAMRTNVCGHIGRGVRGGCERSRHTEGQPGVRQREVLRDVCRAAETRREAPAWSGSFGSNARGSSCEPRVAAEYGGPRQSLRGEAAPVQCSGTWVAAPTCLRRATARTPG